MRGFEAPPRRQERRRATGLGALVALVAVVLVVLFAAILLGWWPPPAGVSDDEWLWCTNRTKDSGPGFVEAAGAIFLGWTPDGGLDHDGVTGMEVAARPNAGIACRVAYVLSPYHPSLALTAEERAWCSTVESRPVLAWVTRRLGSGALPGSDRTCLLGFIVRSISPTGS